MQTIDELKEVLQQLVIMASGVATVIPTVQSSNLPTGLYATYKIIPVRNYGWSKRTRELIAAQGETTPEIGEWQDLRETLATSMEFMLTVDMHNAGADSAILQLQNANLRQPVSEFLYHNQIAWRYVSPCRDLTEATQTDGQPHWQADIHLFIEHTLSYELQRAAGFTVQYDELQNDNVQYDNKE